MGSLSVVVVLICERVTDGLAGKLLHCPLARVSLILTVSHMGYKLSDGRAEALVWELYRILVVSPNWSHSQRERLSGN